MNRIVSVLAGLALCCGLSAPAWAAEAPPCRQQDGRIVREVAGEVAGAAAFRQALGNGWTFALAPAAHGWTIAVLDANGTDLTQLTPPWRFEPNPRELYGWHFRSADNSGPNAGDVNAPQDLRAFLISPGVSGTGGFRPPAGALSDPAALEAEGSGVLAVLDYGLADLAPGQQARMVYLKFSACLSWLADAAPAAPGEDPGDAEQFGACGLGRPYALDRRLAPATLSGDFDGDGAHDIAAPVARDGDGAAGIAVCRAGTWLHLVGFDDDGAGALADLAAVDGWRLLARAAPGQAAGGASQPLRGDAITLSAAGAERLLFWDGAEFRLR